jgi:hypothetical protein
MKRNMDLIRKILIQIEEHDESQGAFVRADVDGHTSEEVIYHCVLLKEAGLIEAEIMQYCVGHGDAAISRLTWAGHEFLDATKSSKVWEGAKAFAVKTTGTVTLEGIKLAIPHVMKMLMSGQVL